MKKSELKKIFTENDVYRYDYSLDKTEPVAAETVLCMRQEGKEYIVYTSDRGERLNVRRFNNESDACNEMLRDMATDHEKLKKYVA